MAAHSVERPPSASGPFACDVSRALGRALIADPYLPLKLQRGHPEDIRPCLRCNEYCIGRIWNRHTKLSCAVNPQAMEEVRFALRHTSHPKDVVVVGGGVAGMETARVAAIEGHKVTLLERRSYLGAPPRTLAVPRSRRTSGGSSPGMRRSLQSMASACS